MTVQVLQVWKSGRLEVPDQRMMQLLWATKKPLHSDKVVIYYYCQPRH